MRSALSCLKAVLSAFEDKESWASMASLSELLSLVLGLCLDERPKVRKCAQDCIAAVLRGTADASSARGTAHPGLSLVAQFIKLVLQGATRKDSAKALHLAPLLRKLVPSLDQGAIDGLLGPLLQCCGLGSGHLSVAYFGVLQELCRTEHGAAEAVEGDSQPRLVQLNLGEAKKILDGLHRLKPASFELAEIAAAWIGALGSCLAHPSLQGRLDEAVLSGHLASLFEGLASSKEAVLLSCQLAFSRLSASRLPDLLLGALQRASTASGSTSLPYLLAIIRDQVMLLSSTTTSTTTTNGPALSPAYAGILEAVGRLHDDRSHADCRSDCVRAIHDFVRVFGPEPVLSVLPLNLEPTGGRAQVSRAWLLPILREAVWNADLGLFTRHLLPLADRLGARAAGFQAAGKPGDAKVYETVVFQLWSLVPAFLRYPSGGFAPAFAALAPRMAAVINEDPVLRPILVNALTAFMERTANYDVEQESGDLGPLLRPVDTSAALQTLGSLAASFLPLLFNLLGVTKAEQRHTLLRCIRAFLDVVSGEESAAVQGYFARVAGHLGSSQSAEEQACMLELLCTMAAFLGEAEYAQLVQMGLAVLAGATEPALQKAAYKALHLAMAHELFAPGLLARLLAAEDALVNASAGLVEVSAVRKCRFRLLLALTPLLPDGALHWIPLLLPEAILGTKEVNQKTRLLAFELLLAFARRMARGGLVCIDGASTTASLEEYLTMVLAGLAGRTPHMISATVVALARLLFDLAPSIPPATLHALLGDILLLFGSPSREIVKAAFGCVKVAVVVLPPEQVQPHLAGLVSSILAWSGEHAMHFKVRVRHLLERLIRRFGYEAIAAIIPAEHHRLITNIRKRKDRARRQKVQRAMAGEDEANEEEEEEDDDHLDRITTAALSKQTSMMTRRGIASTATRPSARFEAALYDSESDIDASEDEDADEAVDTAAMEDDDLEVALSRKLSLRTRALTAKTAAKSTAAKTALRGAAKKTLPSKKSNASDFKLNPEGKMIIEETDEEAADEDDAVVIDENAHRLYEQSLKTFSRPGKHVKFSNKRSRNDDDDVEDEEDGAYAPSAATHKSALSRLSKVSRRPASTAAPRAAHSGQEFKAKRGAGGDVKPKKCKVEPYAYVPLQRSTKTKGSGRNTYFLQKHNKKQQSK
jgi:ribosomal RNA-processing protein 12